MVEVVSSIQVYAFGLLVDGHDSQADVQRAKELPSLNLKTQHFKFKQTTLEPTEQTQQRSRVVLAAAFLLMTYVLLRL